MSLHNTQSISIAWRKGFNDTCVNFAAGFTRGIFKIYGFYDRLKKYIAWNAVSLARKPLPLQWGCNFKIFHIISEATIFGK